MTMEGKGGKELPDKDEVTGNKLVHEGINVNKDSEFKTGTVNDVVKRGGVGTLESKGSQLLQPEQSQEAAICWERFLHVTSIKVLLVENDDSTRHVVTALLRNCNYEVIEAANGWQAWKILENLTNQVDLVLSEVAMPCLSGIGLLCKIMSHKTRKNIPVIMTSSHDSVGLVFKCLSKGAADFLLKPVRKNELKNLWQHVWRRCLSSSGSGSGTQSQKSVKSKGSQRSENASGRNDEEYNQGNASPGNGSDDGNGMQSSSKKQAVEVDISQAVSPCDQTPEPADSICGQVLSANAETSARRSAHMNPSRECLEEEPDDTGKGKTSITSSVRDPELEPENAVEVPLKHCGARHKIALEIEETPTDNSPPSDHHVVTATISHDRGELNKVADALEINNTSTNESKHHVIELSLKRLRGLRESGMTFQDDRNVLRRSEHSAFSRYSSSSNLTRTPQGITQRNSLIEDSMEIAKIEPVHDIEAHMNEKLVNSMSNGVNNIITMDSTTNILISKPLALRDTINGLQLLSAFKPVTSDCRNSSQQTVKVEPGDIQTPDALAPQNSHDNVVIQHHHHHHNHHHYHNLNQNCTSNHDDLSLKQMDVDGPHCASSNFLASFCEGNPKHHSLNRSASGSNHGSNEQSGSSNTVNAGGSNGNSDTGIAGTSRSGGDASGSGSGNRMDHFKLVRAAALTKFRQKRKERCFMKKVRYQNRQRLAEQRPRVRGQFVRHTNQNNLSNSADG